MKLTPLLALAALALGLAAGPARAEERVYDMPTFERVEVTAGVSAIVEAGPAQAIRADAPNAATLDRLTVDVRDGTLRLGIEGNLVTWLFNLGQRRPIVVHVTAPAIRAAAASSGADIDVRGLSGDAQLSASSGAAIVATIAAGADVSLDASSGASLRVSGSCTRLVADATSGASISARDLACDTVKATASSGGHATVRARTAIEADASVGGGIEVSGNPGKVQVNSSMGGSVDMSP